MNDHISLFLQKKEIFLFFSLNPIPKRIYTRIYFFRIVENETGEEEDTEDDESVGDERDIWSVTHVTEEDFETTEGESEDLYDKLMEMTGWKVTDNENENENDFILV